MSLSASTLTIFLLLVPGLIFRFTVYEGSQVKRPFFSSNTIYSSIAVLLYSTVIIILFIVLIDLAILIYNLFWSYDFPFKAVEFHNSLFIFHSHRRYEIVNFFVNFPKTAILSFLGLCLTSFAAALLVQGLSRHTRLIGRLMYGPLAPLISKPDTVFLTCFVLTKVAHQNRRLIYAGYPSEISLKEGNNIDHIIIENPEKFYLRLNPAKPTSSFLKAKPISTQAFSQSYIFVSGSEIENVHFEAFYF